MRKVKNIGVVVALLVLCNCYIVIVTVIIKVVIRILKLDLREEGFSNSGKSINSIFVAVAYRLNKGKINLAVSNSRRKTKCGERIVKSSISFYRDYECFF